MPDREARKFRNRLTAVLAVLGLLTAGSVVLFGHLLFKSLSRDVVNDALLLSRLDAERIARGVAEKSAGDPYIVKLKQTEIDRFVRQGLAERQILTEVQIVDVRKQEVIYSYGSTLKVPEASPQGVEGGPSNVEPVLPLPRTYSIEAPIANPYDIEVPIGEFAVLRFGVSRKELARRVEKLRNELYLRTAAAAVASLLGIGAASAAMAILYRRTRRAEEARVEAERRAELGEVAAGLAHEIRNPLNAMSLNLEMLEEQLERAAKGSAASAGVAADLALAARQETGRLAKLLTDFLAYARPSPISSVAADLNEPAGEAVSFLSPEAAKRGIVLDFAPHPGGAPARLDAARVKQVVLNLIGNALDAVEDEKAVAREVHVRVDEEGSFWRLTVTDLGPGVPDDRKEELFRLFESTKPAGTGLGLPIADRIVRAHGGTLTIHSEKGQPTRAVATFPKLPA
ncbi:MAG TPA: HAMP domain-containing sensor histidine kinase [Thermoanaerobaculia bacterium]|nr:HAMP domain-containing sensor histidine kinase [Thermoanaerobaculia bacterium]HQR67962.1 HAMP domain-containing sensor histidine kinase [Thermoanaerobaculia bacterium]